MHASEIVVVVTVQVQEHVRIYPHIQCNYGHYGGPVKGKVRGWT